jgi:hypothetical protein
MDVKATIAHLDDHSKMSVSDLGGWLISDITVGYADKEVVLGRTMRAMVGLTNLTATDIKLHFQTNQKIRLRVTDAAGTVIFETPEDTHTSPADETIAATKGAYWTESIELRADKFKVGTTYFIDGILVSTTYPAAARVAFTIPR